MLPHLCLKLRLHANHLVFGRVRSSEVDDPDGKQVLGVFEY